MSANPNTAKCALEGHDYQPRHDEVTNLDATVSANFWSVSGKPARIIDRVWVADVCSKCGDLITRRR